MSKKEIQVQTYLQNSQKKINKAIYEKEFAFLKTIATTASPISPTPVTTARPVMSQTQVHPKPTPQPIIHPAAHSTSPSTVNSGRIGSGPTATPTKTLAPTPQNLAQ